MLLKSYIMHFKDIRNLSDNERSWIRYFNWAAKATTSKMVAKRLEKLILKFSLARLLTLSKLNASHSYFIILTFFQFYREPKLG